ncbi:unnamed protein product [Amoebophrya sp. A25]|nr:unnamed protein product [Amoebophrya sp. A25]|eukprot:GSA25T00005027001.1
MMEPMHLLTMSKVSSTRTTLSYLGERLCKELYVERTFEELDQYDTTKMQTNFDNTALIAGNAPVQPPYPNHFNQAVAEPTTLIRPGYGGRQSGILGGVSQAFSRPGSVNELDRTVLGTSNYRVPVNQLGPLGNFFSTQVGGASASQDLDRTTLFPPIAATSSQPIEQRSGRKVHFFPCFCACLEPSEIDGRTEFRVYE